MIRLRGIARATLVQRGGLLVGFTELFEATVSIIVAIKLSFQIKNAEFIDAKNAATAISEGLDPPSISIKAVFLYTSILGFVSGIITSLLAVTLIMAIVKKSTCMLKAWLIPNCFFNGLTGVVAVICLFTPPFYVGILLSFLFVFRAYVCWIVAEVLLEIRAEKEQNTLVCPSDYPANQESSYDAQNNENPVVQLTYDANIV